MATKEKKLYRILSIDGGGIRGIIPGRILVELEKYINEAEKAKGTKNPDARIGDYFDLIAGTSTGGILTCAYLCPDPDENEKLKFTAKEVVNLYLKNGGEIFKRTFWYKIWSVFGWANEKFSSKNLEKILKYYFQNTLLSELHKPCVVTSYDIERRHGHFFSQHNARENIGWDFKITDVARSTSAAPTYFECARILSEASVYSSLIDGGVFVNNPALCAYAEAREIFEIGAKDMIILSLGTGSVKNKYLYKKAKRWGKIGWLKPLIDIMMSGVAEVVHFQLKQIFETVKAPHQYVRINTDLKDTPVDPAMDDADDENIKALEELGKDTATLHKAELQRIAKLLVDNHSVKPPLKNKLVPKS